jgi:hypothetical protein
MIRHCVFVKYRPDFGTAARAAIIADLSALRQKLGGMHEVQAGRNVSPEGLGKGFGDGFVIDFDDAAARDAYLADPDHQAIGARIVAAASGGVDGLLVFDFDLG